MRYNGGKQGVLREIIPIINSYSSGTYWEPFAGACNVLAEVASPIKAGSDADESIIALMNAVMVGWEPPTVVTEDEYRAARLLPASNPLHGFCKYGCSFGGKPWGGYARDKTGRNYAANAARSLERQARKLRGVTLWNADYKSIPPEFDLIYCDPPYRGTTSVGCGGKFDSDEFFSWALSLPKQCTVLVSERSAPDGFSLLWEKRLADGLGKSKLTERLYIRE